jgi:hypothetical protein
VITSLFVAVALLAASAIDDHRKRQTAQRTASKEQP